MAFGLRARARTLLRAGRCSGLLHASAFDNTHHRFLGRGNLHEFLNDLPGGGQSNWLVVEVFACIKHTVWCVAFGCSAILVTINRAN